MGSTDKIAISINPDVYAAKCESALQARMHNLNIAMNSLKSGIAGDLGAAHSPQPGVTLAFTGASDPIRIAQNALADTVCNMIHDLLSFDEELMAIEDLTKDHSNITIPLPPSQKEVEDIIIGEIRARTASIARDHRITTPAKLKRFLPETSWSYRAAQSYVDLRNCIEHHHWIPKAELRVIVRSIILPPIGVPLKEAVTMSVRERTITHRMGQRTELRYQDIHDIATTCTLGLFHDIRNSALGLRTPQ